MSDTVRRLLVVDDEPDFADFVKRTAEGIGYEALALSDPNRFKDAFAESQPDVIVLDMVMPDIEGIELIQWLAEQGCKAKILVVTGYNPYYGKMALGLGEVRGLIVETHQKPISLATLRDALS
ncbi:MAG: response regulator [Rhodospirillaceae bacterium]|jgi:DNA-binding response OmpR family regulator|nr:response regulator [Rhodospirillaceae bacterium]MBT4687596.1 response regulator [Rhodospirillaceae bacterium]MBT5082044.1 response regulator [Rhodospirillaceae bacterium]MBT5524748.1 response regulator [Rhodospirillaceae bacterium]MBT5881211.1 response regulator [Rhodospirillaceae bacterium]